MLNRYRHATKANCCTTELFNCLIVTPNFESRNRITKFRCSDHKLMIEKGRHKNINVEVRLCHTVKAAYKNQKFSNSLLMVLILSGIIYHTGSLVLK